MRQLTGMDAFHLLSETPAQHMHTIKIAVVDAAAAGEPITFETTREWAARRFLRIPPLRCKLATVPLGLARPFLVDVGAFDLDYHVRRATIAAPGGDAELDEAVSVIASTGLDRTKPLWQLWFVDGLAGGRVALVLKLHHSIADGFASVRIFESIFETVSGEGADEAAAADRHGEPVPSPAGLVRLGIRSQAQLIARLPGLVRRTGRAMRAGRARKSAGGIPATRPLAGPPTRFNRTITADRIYVNVTLPLDELRRLGTDLGCTLNTVFLALCGGALRRYLQDRGELPAETMTAAMPVSIRHPGEEESYGNRISYWYVSLATDVDEPLDRLARVGASVQAAREWNQGDLDLPAEWEDFSWLFVRGVMGLLEVAEHRTGKVACNITVSNVRGPGPLRCQGAPVVAVRSMGPIERTRGINFTAWSYGHDFSVGIHSCRDVAPDLREVADGMVAELAALEAAAGVRTGAPGG